MVVEIDESQRQLIMLALARLSLDRPGWHFALGEVAKQFPGGPELYDEFRYITDPDEIEGPDAIDFVLARWDKSDPMIQREIAYGLARSYAGVSRH